ncbi:MAG: QacE family quaternary ammonium compound efflux SMR transporter [Rhodopirellula sp. TMED11]|nr:MAG: QacE family quaternary ammonium compound efflux SMR transporter [Rhodopirellula sp. TMED11]
MAWLILVIAGLFEVGWAIGLKYTEGFTKLLPSIWTVGAIVVSMTMLAIALRTLPVGTGYAVWVGIGTVGTVTLGIIWFDEPASAGRLFFVTLIIVGIVGLKWVTPIERPKAVHNIDPHNSQAIAGQGTHQPRSNATN